MSKHLLIAGTGRAGTSFLVRYLTHLGLETTISRSGAAAQWDTQANAGFENIPLPNSDDLPYVIKSPWTYQFIQELLANQAMEFDAILIPMRDLTEAAASRCIIELQEMHRTLPWMAQQGHTWENIGHTPGGVVYSANPVDQARLLAVGFHQLLQEVVKADIPIVLLSFPRFIEEPEYLYRKLAPVFPQPISLDLARQAHGETADPGMVRVGRELQTSTNRPNQGFSLNGPSHEQLDRAALRRALTAVRQDLADARAQLTAAVSAEQMAQKDSDSLRHDLQQTQQAVTSAMMERDTALQEAAVQQDTAQSLRQTAQALAQDRDRREIDSKQTADALVSVTEQKDLAHEALCTAKAIAAEQRQQLDSMQQATTWRMALLLQHAAKRTPAATAVGRWLLRHRQ